MHGMVALSDGRAGLAVLTEGLFEYEVFDDERRAIALSLVRSFPIKLQVSEEKKEVLPDTGVQCPGPQSFRYAILPFEGGVVEGGVLPAAQRFVNPPRVIQVAAGPGQLPREFSLLRVEGPGLVVTAVKRCENSDELLVRLFNSDTQTRTGRLTFGCRVGSVRTAELDESVIGELAVGDNGVDLTLPPKKIVTLLVRA